LTQVTIKSNTKGQSALEYALLIIAVAAALITMQRYVTGAVNDRLHDIEKEINPPAMVITH